jgi:GxxExxY protein
MGELLIDELNERVIGSAIAVHTAFGPGLLESIYQDCLFVELTLAGIPVVQEHPVPVMYRGHRPRGDLKIDLLVDGRLVVEVKAVDRLHPVHQAQVITYLKLTDCPAGLLLNFNATSLRAGLKRLDHPTIYAEKLAAKRRGAPLKGSDDLNRRT